MMLRTFFFILLVGSLLTSCVGTIEDTTKKTSEASIVKPINLLFNGITKGIAVSHNKVQLYFKPAFGGSNNYSYLVYLDGNLSTPVSSVSQSELSLDKNGEYSVGVTSGLTLGTNYTFLVRAFDSQYNLQDTNNIQVSVQTLNYKTPLFEGVQAVQSLAGKEGETSLLVKWNPATPATESGGIFGGNADAISGYNIYMGDSEENLIFYTSINDPNTTSIKLNGLESGKLYYFRVRAKNSQVVPVEELNFKFLTKMTLTHLPILFGGVSSVFIPSTTAGFSSLIVQWNPGSGNYDRYKIYARKDPVSSFNPASTDYLITTVTDLSLSSVTINVPDPHTIWYVAVVACSDGSCTEGQGQNVIKYVRTSPPVASFNGIKTLTQPAGGEGLSAMDITWDLPDSNTGVYDEIRIFKSDVNGNFDPFLDRVDITNYDVGNPNVMGVTLRASTFIRVNGLETAKQACFVALAYSTSPIDPSTPDGRTGLTRIVKCSTPQYNIPGFSGVKLSCTNKTAKTFKITWDAPNPKGTYEDYEIYYKEGTSGFSVADALALSEGYTRKVVTSDVLNYTLTNLLMNTSYQILVKSHFYNGVNDQDYRDNNSIIATCSTSSPLVEQGPWFELYSIGPKFDGLKGVFLPEVLTPLSGAVDGQTGASVNKPEWKHQYPVESTGSGLGVTESVNGIIRIAWDDMLLSDDLGHLRDYNNVQDTGYKVYRVVHNPIFGSSGPALNDTAWGEPVNAGFVQAPTVDVNIYNRYLSSSMSKSFAQFIDYSLVHPYNDDPAFANQATVYWYKVEAWYNGKKLAFASTASDAVLRMVLPPKNMAFIHRWMSNKQICDDMGMSFLRSNNYKCEYTGLGAVLDPVAGKYYYDMKGDLLVDRFEMGCNFSRGATLHACSNTGGLVGFEGDVDDPTVGKKAGDCVSKSTTNNPTGKITAKQGAVFYSRYSQECFVNTSVISGTTWKVLSEIDGNSFNTRQYFETGTTTIAINPGLTKIPPTYGASVSTTVPVTLNNSYYSRYSQGVGYGAKIYSNDSKLPPLIKWTDPIALHYSCQSSQVKINGVSYPKKLSRRKEFVSYAAESPLLSATDRNLLDRGSAQYTNDSPLGPIKNYLTMSLAEHNDRDCNSTYNMYGYYNPADGKIYNDIGFTSFTGSYNYVSKVKNGTTSLGHVNTGTVLNYNDPRYVTGGNSSEYAMVETGSSGPLSTEACVSRFGIQDHLGNASEYTSDLLYCNPLYGCSSAFKDAAKSVAFTPPIDPENMENYKNANGEYFSVTDVTTSGASTASMGTRLLPRNIYSSPNRNFLTDMSCWDYNFGIIALNTGSTCGAMNANFASATQYGTSKYFNVALGIPLDCEGASCQYEGANDSNTLVTARTLPPAPTTLVTKYQAGSAEMSQIAGVSVNGSRSTNASIVGIVNGGDPRTGGSASRYNLLFNGHDGYMSRSTGRCDVLLPESY